MASERCVVCRGKGQRWTGKRWEKCRDCLGSGVVRHCVACVRRPGLLWLGGDEYLECPACEGTGKIKPRRTYLVQNGVLTKAPPGPVVAVRRDPRLELTR